MIWSLVDRSQSSRNAEQKKVLEAATANGLRLWFTNGMPLGPHYEEAGRGRMNFNGALHAKCLVAKIPGAKPGKRERPWLSWVHPTGRKHPEATMKLESCWKLNRLPRQLKT